MVKAVWNDIVIAESGDTVVVENNHYFPPASVKMQHLKKTATTSVCGWKGTAGYYSLIDGAAENKDAAWYYADPKNAADAIKGRIAFWKGVKVG